MKVVWITLDKSIEPTLNVKYGMHGMTLKDKYLIPNDAMMDGQ